MVEYPENSGLPTQHGQVLIAQVHYNLVAPDTHGLSDQTTIRLRLDPQVENLGFFVVFDPFLESLGRPDAPLSLPAGERSAKFSWQRTGQELDFKDEYTMMLRGVMPHMHQLGRKYRLTYSPDDQTPTVCATDVQQWDFHWQRMYFFEDPLPLTTKTQLAVTCDYDTSSVTQPVTPGWSTQNEMCATTFYFTLPLSALVP